MLDWLRKNKSASLTGAPAVRRQKTYSAQSGYVYQYVYEGQRPAVIGEDKGKEYVFDVTADRRTSFVVSVFVGEGVVSAWEREHRRSLSATERYAIAKLALFQAFDERPDPARMRDAVCVRAADIEAILEALGIE
jgi:hypothetical protein